jgi:hypothetical protein
VSAGQRTAWGAFRAQRGMVAKSGVSLAGCRRYGKDLLGHHVRSPRPPSEPDCMLDYVREGDSVVVWKLDRLMPSSLLG